MKRNFKRELRHAKGKFKRGIKKAPGVVLWSAAVFISFSIAFLPWLLGYFLKLCKTGFLNGVQSVDELVERLNKD